MGTIKPFLVIFAFFFSAAAAAAAIGSSCSRSHKPNELPVFHVYSKCSPFSNPTNPSPGLDSALALARQDPARLAFLTSFVASVPVASGQQLMQTANYVVRTKLGTPGQTMFMALDTGADASWVPCSGCVGCPSSKVFSQAASSTYTAHYCSSPWCTQFGGQACTAPASVACVFNMSYGGDSSFAAAVVQDSLMLGKDVVGNYTFGCVNSVAAGNSFPKQGLLGLGRGPTSLLSQTGSLYQGVFSYCLPSFRSYYFSGSLRLGPANQPRSMRTTPLLRNPHRPSLFYVNLTGISIGRTQLSIPTNSLAFDPATGAGTIIDSGTVITRFVAPLYAVLRDEFRKQVGAGNYTSLGAFDTCFDYSGASQVPAFVLHLEKMDLVLPVENILIHSSSGTLACLAMAAVPENVNTVVNVIANLQQQNHRVLVDVANARVGFARELCS